MNNLLLRRRRNSDLQAPTSDGLNNLTQALTIRYDSTERHVSLHGPPQCGLRLLGQIIKLMYDNDLE